MKYAGFNKEDMADCLSGFCCSFWTQGCPFHCKGCHNPESWDFNGGIELTEEDYNEMIESFGKGIHKDFSILGGEPLANLDLIKFLNKMIKDIKEKDNTVKVYLWTGYTLKEIIKICEVEINLGDDYSLLELMNKVDYLIDGRFEIDNFVRRLPLRGSTNQKIRKNLKANTTEYLSLQQKDIINFFDFEDISDTVDKERKFLG